MEEAKLYYTAPTDEQFIELKERAIEIWSTMGDEPSYSEGKIARIKDIKNYKDNFMYMVGMFDNINQRRLANKLTEETRVAVSERLKSGGSEDIYNEFI